MTDDKSQSSPQIGSRHVLSMSGTAETWHRRLVHALQLKAVSLQVRIGLLPAIKAKTPDCNDYARAKVQCKLKASLTPTSEIGILNIDNMGKLKVESAGGYNYFL